MEDGLSFSLDSNLGSEKHQANNSDNCGNTIISGSNNNNNNNSINCFLWNCDKSDLGSIDSNFFKNSMHQNEFLDKLNTLNTSSVKFISRAQIHNENNSNGSVTTGTIKSENNPNNIKNNCIENSVNINEDTESGVTIIEIREEKKEVSGGPTSSVISYDSIYLSSESDKQTVVGDTINDLYELESKIKDFEKIIQDLNLLGDNEKPDSIIDNLYGQVAKGNRRNFADSKDIDLSNNFTEFLNSNTLERLAVLSGYDRNKNCEEINEYLENNPQKKETQRNYTSNKNFQYSSLPDEDVSKQLQDCEAIDAKLRDDVSIEPLEPFPDYDTVSIDQTNDSDTVDNNKQKENNNLFDRVNGECLNEPVSLEQAEREEEEEEENPKGAPSIELVQLSKNIPITENNNTNENNTKIYIPDLGLELDYENSIASFESDNDFDSPVNNLQGIAAISNEPNKPSSLNLVTISGKKVIVDELAAKTEHRKKELNKKCSESVQIETKSLQESNNNFSEKINGSICSKTNIDKKREKEIKLFAYDCGQSSLDGDKNSDNKIVCSKKFSDSISHEKDLKVDCVESAKEQDSNQDIIKMPRPQLLNIIDSKANKKNPNSTKKSEIIQEVDNSCSASIKSDTEKEFLHKVDSVRNYWSKMLVDDNEINSKKNLKSMSNKYSSSKSTNDIPESLRKEEDGFQSFFPTVEIVELNNGETQAALITSRKLNDVEFDHVRYKVMKSDMFQKNIVKNSNHRKENQFDGLMQYLKDYSFQDLLANNNVVIIEPVRTKIEKISDNPNKGQAIACKITNGAALNRNGSNNLKKHFFYHPIRVNKELYENELPVPDTVRNVRKLFEDTFQLRCPESECSEKESKTSASTENLKPRKTIRYLAIDTSFDNNISASKWDSISLSSGVSSAADLNSPCECRDVSNRNAGSKDMMKNNEEFEREIMEKLPYEETTENHMEQKLQEKDSSLTNFKALSQQTNEKCNCQAHSVGRNSTSSEKQSENRNKMYSDYIGKKIKLNLVENIIHLIFLYVYFIQASNSN